MQGDKGQYLRNTALLLLDRGAHWPGLICLTVGNVCPVAQTDASCSIGAWIGLAGLAHLTADDIQADIALRTRTLDCFTTALSADWTVEIS